MSVSLLFHYFAYSFAVGTNLWNCWSYRTQQNIVEQCHYHPKQILQYWLYVWGNPRVKYMYTWHQNLINLARHALWGQRDVIILFFSLQVERIYETFDLIKLNNLPQNNFITIQNKYYNIVNLHDHIDDYNKCKHDIRMLINIA